MDGPASTHPNAEQLLLWTLDNWHPRSAQDQAAPAGRGQQQRSRLLRLKTRGVRQTCDVSLLEILCDSVAELGNLGVKFFQFIAIIHYSRNIFMNYLVRS